MDAMKALQRVAHQRFRQHDSPLDITIRVILSPMAKPRRVVPFLPLDDALFTVKQRKTVPHQFVLDAIAALLPTTRPVVFSV